MASSETVTNFPESDTAHESIGLHLLQLFIVRTTAISTGWPGDFKKEPGQKNVPGTSSPQERFQQKYPDAGSTRSRTTTLHQ